MPAWPVPWVDRVRGALWLCACVVWTTILASVLTWPAYAQQQGWVPYAEWPLSFTLGGSATGFQATAQTVSIQDGTGNVYAVSQAGVLPAGEYLFYAVASGNLAGGAFVFGLGDTASCSNNGSLTSGSLTAAPLVRLLTRVYTDEVQRWVCFRLSAGGTLDVTGIQVYRLAPLGEVVPPGTLATETTNLEILQTMETKLLAVEAAVIGSGESAAASAATAWTWLAALFYAALAGLGFFGYSVGSRDV